MREFGDYPFKVPDQLQADWTQDIADVEFDAERDCIVVVPD